MLWPVAKRSSPRKSRGGWPISASRKARACARATSSHVSRARITTRRFGAHRRRCSRPRRRSRAGAPRFDARRRILPKRSDSSASTSGCRKNRSSRLTRSQRVARAQVFAAAVGQADADVTRMEAARTQALADQRFAEAQLANTVIRAPFTGVVVKKMAEVGESVAPIPPGVNLSTSSGAIVALADLDTLEVDVDVAEANVAKLSSSQPAEVTVEAFPEKRYAAALRQIIPTADRTKATVSVKVTIRDRDPKLKPEMSAKATFLERTPASGAANAAPAQPQILVPPQTVITRDGGPKVFEVVDGRVKVLAV